MLHDETQKNMESAHFCAPHPSHQEGRTEPPGGSERRTRVLPMSRPPCPSRQSPSVAGGAPGTHGSSRAVTKGRQGAVEPCLQERAADQTHGCDQGPAWMVVIARHTGQERACRPGDRPPSRDGGTWSPSQNSEAASVRGRARLQWAEMPALPSAVLPGLVRLSRPSAGLQTKRSRDGFPFRSHGWAAGLVSSGGHVRGNQSLYLSHTIVSLSFSLPPSSKSKIFKNHNEKQVPG